jgi:TolB-like protein/Flp pilus assembly protein TadD
VLRSFGYHERITAEEHLLVREILERAVEHAPASADGWANLSLLYAEEYKHAFNERPDALDRALDAARRAVAAAPSNHLGYQALAQALFFRRELAAFRNAADRVVALNPMDGGSVAFMGILISYAGDWDRGCALAERAMQLNPHHPGWYRFASFNNAYRQGDDRAALDIALKFNMPSYFYTHVAQAVACAQLGERDAARRALGELLAQKPDFAAIARHELEKWNYAVPDLVERYLDGLRKAGLDLHDGGAGPEPRPVPGALAGVGAPAGDPPQASIAVLPFASLSADRDDEFLADGISEEIINALVQIPDLKVAARTSAFTFKGNTDDLRVVGEKLGVRTVLQGSVRRAGSRLRITVQLVGVDDGYHLWSERYDRDMADVFAVQDEIASNIAARLELTLGGGGRGVPRGASEALGTSNVEAYELYLKGRHLWYQRTPVSLSGAVDYFSQAIRLDPGFASAHAGLSDALSIQRATGNVPYASTYPMAAAAARRAAELMPDAVEVQIALAYHESYYGDDWTRAEAHWRRALELDPRSPLAHGQYALFLAAYGRRDEAHHHAAKGREHDPLSPFLAALEGMGRFILGEFDAAVASCAAALELQGNFPLALIMRGLSLSRLGRHGEAIGELETAAEATRRGVMFVGALGQAYGRAGDREAAARIIEELERRSSEGEYVSPFGLLHVHLGLGDRVGLERALRACLDDRMPPITICVAGADALRALATEPTLDDLLGRLRLPR